LFTRRSRYKVARCSIAAALGKRPTLTAFAPPKRSLKQESDATSAIYLWCRGRLQHGRIDRPPTNDAFIGLVLSMCDINALNAARFTRI
jgi:hypothetical protein